jgi:N-acetylmuramoyl-L-alanine amidase
MLKRTYIFKIALLMGLNLAFFGSFAQKLPLQTIILDPGHGGPDQGASGAYSTEAQCALAISFKIRDILKKELPAVKVLMTREKDEFPGGVKTKNDALNYRAQFANSNNGDLFLCIHLNSANPKYGRKLEGYRTETYYVTTGKGRKKKKIAKTREVPIYSRYKLPFEEQAHGTETYIWAASKQKNKLDALENTAGRMDDEGVSDSAYQALINSAPYKIRLGRYAQKYFNNSKTLAEFVEEGFVNSGRHSRGVMQRNEKGILVLQATGMPSILVETGYLNSEAGQMEVANVVVAAVKKYKEMLEAKIKTSIAVPVSSE